MTKEELYNNYEFKIVKRTLMNEFPFIKDVYVKDPDTIDQYRSFIFLDADINPYELSHMYGLKVDKLVEKYLRRGEPYWGPYLSLFITGGVEDTWPIKKAIGDLINGIHMSPAIPPELKLDRELEISSYRAKPDTLPPDMMSYK